MSDPHIKLERDSFFLWWGRVLHWSPPLLVASIATGILYWVAVRLISDGFLSQPDCGERIVRFCALLLQIVGFTLVVRGILGARATFGQKTLTAGIKQYFRRFPKRTRRGVAVISGTGNINVSVVLIATGTVWPSADSDLTTRVNVLQAILERLDKEVAKIPGEFTTVRSELNESLRTETTAREEAFATLKALSESASIGDARLDLFGVACFVFGAILGSLSPEIAHALGAAPTCSWTSG